MEWRTAYLPDSTNKDTSDTKLGLVAHTKHERRWTTFYSQPQLLSFEAGEVAQSLSTSYERRRMICNECSGDLIGSRLAWVVKLDDKIKFSETANAK